MKSKLTKLFLFLIVLGAIFWLGGMNIRALIGNELFEKNTIYFRSDLTPDYQSAILFMLANSTIVTLIAYVVVFISTIVFISLSKPNLKEKGWLMASLILFFMFTPLEFYTGYLDFKYIITYFFYGGDGYTLKMLFLKRVVAIGGLPAIAIFCYYTIVGLLVWRPLDKTGAKIKEN
jgi:hypothetical protein